MTVVSTVYPPIDKRLVIKLAKEKILGYRSSAEIARMVEAKQKRPVSPNSVRKILKAAGVIRAKKGKKY